MVYRTNTNKPIIRTDMESFLMKYVQRSKEGIDTSSLGTASNESKTRKKASIGIKRDETTYI